jgi:hypothetical protein
MNTEMMLCMQGVGCDFTLNLAASSALHAILTLQHIRQAKQSELPKLSHVGSLTSCMAESYKVDKWTIMWV